MWGMRTLACGAASKSRASRMTRSVRLRIDVDDEADQPAFVLARLRVRRHEHELAGMPPGPKS